MIDPEEEILTKSPLASNRDRFNKCSKAIDYFELNGANYILRRSNEESADFEDRPKVSLPITYASIRALTRHLYNPGPTRSHPEKDVNAFLDLAYAGAELDLLAAKADEWALLCGVSAIGLTARPRFGLGNFRLDVFGAHEMATWCLSDDPENPYAVCVISRDRDEVTYTLWNEESQRVYVAKGDIPTKVSEIENPYKRIPFAFYHAFGPVVRHFWEGGIGHYLGQINGAADAGFSDAMNGLSSSIPIAYAVNCDPAQRIRRSPNAMNFLNGRSSMANGPTPEIGFAQSPYDARLAFSASSGMAESAIEYLGVPRSAFVAGGSMATSGVALLLEQMPLIVDAQRRKRFATRFETRLATMVLESVGNFYQMPKLVTYAKVPISITWPEPRLPVPLPDQDASDDQLLNWRLISRVELAMRRFGVSRDEAIRRLIQVDQDEALLSAGLAPANPADASDPSGASEAEDGDPDASPTITEE